MFSYAGRTEAPVAQPLPQRIGGFGGIPGLVSYLREQSISHVVDATHPFAARISRNALAACDQAGVALITLERPPWTPAAQDRWTEVPDIASAVAALPAQPSRIFLAIGRQNLEDFAARSEHHYILRLVDQPGGALPLPQSTVILARGPFTLEGDLQLMREQAVQLVVSKNAGGVGARAKLDAARVLGIGVVMIGRPPLPERACVASVAEVLEWLHRPHPANLGV